MQKSILIFTGIIFLLEIYVYQAIRSITNNSYIRIGYIVFTLALYAFFVYNVLNFDRGAKDHHTIQLTISLFLIFILPKLLIVAVLLIGDIFRVLEFGVQKITTSAAHFPERRKFISVLGLSFAGVLSALLIDGIAFGKYRHRARRVKVKIKNLPESFKGYKIVQISDAHLGSFFHPEKLQHAIDLINEQNADLVLFTGDMVNNLATEFVPFVDLFKTIKAKDGKYSVLGNHDYADYVEWDSPEAKAQNLLDLIELERQAGFQMLRNEHVFIEKNNEKFYVIGVENWGEKPFPQFGDLDKATKGIPQNAAKILMSHDPTHFDRIVKHHPSDISLTMSGHTHGMQFGLDLKNVKWSPVEYRYPKWIDLYESMGKFLYVNRGFGVLAYPGRVGILPEITVFELR